jgi:hypothetical protein
MRQNHVISRCVVLALSLCALRAATAADQRTYSAGRFSLDLNGERLLVNTVEGGAAVGVVAANGTDKSIAGVKCEDITFSIPLANLPKPVTDALEGKPASINGGIDYLDFNYKGQRRVGFKDASVVAVRFPALDGSSKEAATVEVTLAPQETREEPASGDVKAGATVKQKAALRSAFRVSLPGVHAERVATVSAIEVRAKRVEGAAGTERAPAKSQSGMEIPNIKLTMSPADLKEWQQWLERSLEDRGSKQEKTMRVEFLDPSMKNPVAAIDLSGVGIVAIRTPKAEANSEQIARVEIELYAEQLKFNPGGGATATAAPEQPKEAAPADAPKSEAVIDRPIRRAR